MKFKIGNLIMVLMLLVVSMAYAQDRQPDQRLTAGEQAIFEQSVPVNPARIDPATQIDRKEDPSLGPAPVTNWKPAGALSERQPVTAPAEVPVAQPLGQNPDPARTQPAGAQAPAKPASAAPLTGIKTQPEGAKVAIPANQPVKEGVRTQPEGQKPH